MNFAVMKIRIRIPCTNITCIRFWLKCPHKIQKEAECLPPTGSACTGKWHHLLAKLISLILKIFTAPRYFSGDLNSESQDSAVQDKGTTLQLNSETPFKIKIWNLIFPLKGRNNKSYM